MRVNWGRAPGMRKLMKGRRSRAPCSSCRVAMHLDPPAFAGLQQPHLQALAVQLPGNMSCHASEPYRDLTSRANAAEILEQRRSAQARAWPAANSGPAAPGASAGEFKRAGKVDKLDRKVRSLTTQERSRHKSSCDINRRASSKAPFPCFDQLQS